MVGWYTNFSRVVNLIVWARANFAFMGNREIKNRKEGLVFFGAIFPVSLSTTFVPHFALFQQVVIFIGIICAIISKITEVGRVHFEFRWKFDHTSHMFGSGRGGVHSGNNSGSGGCTNWCVGDRAAVDHSLRGKGIQVWRICIFITVASEVWSIILTCDP